MFICINPWPHGTRINTNEHGLYVVRLASYAARAKMTTATARSKRMPTSPAMAHPGSQMPGCVGTGVGTTVASLVAVGASDST